MHRLRILAAALALLVVTPALAQEMGGAMGPGSSRGLEPSDNSGYYYNGYTAGANAAAPFGALDGNNANAQIHGADAGYCAQRYRSYDPASGTYLGHDGQRHSCR